MTLDLIKQNAKSLIEAIYTYDRLTLQNGDKKEIEKASVRRGKAKEKELKTV